MKRIVIILSCVGLLVLCLGSYAICKTLRIESKSGIVFKADFLESDKSNSPAVLILPGMSARRNPYKSLSKKLNKVGYNVLSINYYMLDKVSTNAKHKEKKKVLDKRGGTMGLVENEVTASLDFLRLQESVDNDRICILGASMGTWTGFHSMAKYRDIKCLIMLSPLCAVSGKSFETYDGTIDLAKAFGDRNLYIVASDDDRHSSKFPSATEKSEYLISIMPNAIIDKKYYSGKSHSYSILTDHKEITDLLINWLNKSL